MFDLTLERLEKIKWIRNSKESGINSQEEDEVEDVICRSVVLWLMMESERVEVKANNPHSLIDSLFSASSLQAS